MTVAHPPGFKTIYFQFSWCLPRKKKDLNLSIVICILCHIDFCCTQCFKVEIYPVFPSRVELILGICHILNLMTTIVHHCSKGMHFTAEYAFFFGSGLLVSNILFDYDHFPQDTRTWGKPTFQCWQQAPPFLLGSVC
jgi:hypothetical protein